jgi:DNA-binding response OmpR family regulator
VEDDAAIRGSLIRVLTEHGHAVTSTASGMAALRHVLDAPPDLVLLDLGLPDLSGYEALKMMRAVSAVPVVVVTAHDDEKEIIRVLDAGADDYVVKPLSMVEVTARLRAQLRRARGFESEETVLGAGRLELDLDARRCTISGREVRLTRREFDLLGTLLSYPGRVHTRAQLLELVWGTDSISLKTVDGHIAALRRKLGAAITIATLRGLGYRLDLVSDQDGTRRADGHGPGETA